MAWKQTKTFRRDGQELKELKLDPDPKLPAPDEMSLGLVEECCFYLQIDVETLLFTNEDVELPEHPALIQAQGFIDALVLNSEEYNIKEMHPAQVKSLIAALTAYFIKASKTL